MGHMRNYVLWVFAGLFKMEACPNPNGTTVARETTAKPHQDECLVFKLLQAGAGQTANHEELEKRVLPMKRGITQF